MSSKFDVHLINTKYGVIMLLGSKKAGKVLVPPLKTLAEMRARLEDSSIEMVDFYLAKKEVNYS